VATIPRIDEVEVSFANGKRRSRANAERLSKGTEGTRAKKNRFGLFARGKVKISAGGERKIFEVYRGLYQ